MSGKHEQEVVSRDFARPHTTVASTSFEDQEEGRKSPSRPVTHRGESAVSKEGSQYPPPARETDVYDRFSKRRKAFILAIVSYNAFLSPMTASIFLPAVPAVAHDLDTTPTIINVTISLFIISIGTAPLLWSPLSGFYGRRPIYLASAPIMLVSSIGVAFSKTVPQLIVTRILQGIGSSSVLAVGAGSIGDIFRPTERSNAMSWFYTGALLGPSVSPVLGAALSEYTTPSWRSTQWFLVGCSGLSVCLTYFFLPETMPPPIPHHLVCQRRGKRFVPFIFNPLAILGLFAWPNISCITFISSATMLMTYVILIPITSAFSEQYGITNIFVLGCFFLATGGGNVIGSRIIGPMADAKMQQYIKKRGHRRPEDRLRAAIFGLGVMLPLSCLGYGWLLETKKGGVGPPVVFMVIQGMGLMFTLTPINTYAVDSMQSRSAEVIAVNNWMRYLFAAAASAFVLPMANAIGWGLTMTVASILVWISFGILLLVIRFGHIWREAANRKHGYDVQADDEKHGPEKARQSQASEASMSASIDPEVGPGSELELEHEHKDEHRDLPPATLQRGVSAKGKSITPVTRQRSTSRVSKDGMPNVSEVLQRTTSLSGASVHGGG